MQSNLYLSDNILSTIKNLGENTIKLFDHDENYNLNLYCYVNCDNISSKFIKNCRGLIFNDSNVVAINLPYPDEFTMNQKDLIEDRLSLFDSFNFYESFEGSVLRLFYFSDKWFLSTNKKIDAFTSKWSSRYSFGELFINALQHELLINKDFKNSFKLNDNILVDFQNSLDKNKKDNRIVCDSPKDSESFLFHIATVEHYKYIDYDLKLCKPKKLDIKNSQDLFDYVDKNVDYKYSQGILCSSSNNLDHFKILNSHYKKMSVVRGNVPNINFRYFQIRHDEDMVKKYRELYPNYNMFFEESENILDLISKNIYNAYVNRFIKKNYTIIPQDQYKIMSECHSWHVLDRSKNKVTLERVKHVLNRQEPFYVFNLVKYNKKMLLKIEDSV